MQVKLYINAENEPEKNGRWISVPFTHPATIETAVMDSDLKTKVKSDLETFLKSKQYYNRLGRVWKRSYLLYGPSGTGKSTFVAGMAKFLCYDIYDIDLSKIDDNSDLRMLLLQTKNKSMIVIEDLDRYVKFILFDNISGVPFHTSFFLKWRMWCERKRKYYAYNYKTETSTENDMDIYLFSLSSSLLGFSLILFNLGVYFLLK